MGETPGFNPEVGGYNIAELAQNPLKASDEVQKLTRVGKYEDAHKLLWDIVDAQQGKNKNEEPKQAKAA